MFLSGFKTEAQAIMPSIFFKPTLETYKKVLLDPTMHQYLRNSLFQVFFGTSLSLLFGIPAAFTLVFGNLKKKASAGKFYLWFITTILLLPVYMARFREQQGQFVALIKGLAAGAVKGWIFI